MPNRRPVIVIDPGHGGNTPVGGSSPNNATGPNGLLEKSLTLDLARRLPALLSADADVVLTRDRDVNLSLADRARAARDRNADLFLSIHLNGFSNPQTDGAEAWVARQASPRSRALAQTLLRHVLAVTGVNDRGVKESDLGVLLSDRHSPRTAATLLEVAFLTNPEQARRFTDERYKQRLAEAIAVGAREHLRTMSATAHPAEWEKALEVTTTVNQDAEVLWPERYWTRPLGGDSKPHLYYLATGAPEGRPATFWLQVTNKSKSYDFKNVFLLLRLEKNTGRDGDYLKFDRIDLEKQKGDYLKKPLEPIAPGEMREIPLKIKAETLLKAYHHHPEHPLTRLTAELHWHQHESSGWRPYKNSKPLGFYLVKPFEVLFDSKIPLKETEEPKPSENRKTWLHVWGQEFPAGTKEELTAGVRTIVTRSKTNAEEVGATGSVTITKGRETSVKESQEFSSKASLGVEEVLKLGFEMQSKLGLEVSRTWSESVARQIAESWRASQSATETWSREISAPYVIRKAEPGERLDLYLRPLIKLYKVKTVTFGGPNAYGQATSRAEREELYAELVGWQGYVDPPLPPGNKGKPSRAQSLDASGPAYSLSADEWNPIVRETLEAFLTRFANIAVNVAGSSVAVRPPYFINRDNERKRRALENRHNAPQADKDIFDQQRFRFARAGKASIQELRDLLQLAVDRQRVPAGGGRPQPNGDDLRGWLVRYGLGIDCSGFVVQALNETFQRAHGGTLNADQRLDLSAHNSAALKGGARGFTTVARPDQLRPGDTMHKPGHIRVVTRVEITGEGHVKFMTAESSSVSDIGPTPNVWRYRDRARFAGLQKERNRAWSGSSWQNVNEHDTFGRYNILAQFVEANSPARTPSLAHYEDLAASLNGNGYGYAQQSSPRIGWPDAPRGGRNAAETVVRGVRRIPVAGLLRGNQQDAPDNRTSESAAGRAIVLIPSEIDTSRPVETLFHLHGYNIGYRQPPGAEPRDIAMDRIPDQLVGARRNIIAVLPQGTTTSGFGRLDTNAYLDEIFAALGSLGVWRGRAPSRGREILSGHSGAGGLIAGILGEQNQPRLPRNLSALLLFDAINVRSGRPASESGELRAAISWVRSRLDRDLRELQRAADPAARSNYLQNSVRVRGYFTPGHYANLYSPLETAINDWFRSHQSDLQSLGQNIEQSLRDHYRLTPVRSLIPQGQSPNHDHILGLGNALQHALTSLVASAAAPATGQPAAMGAEALFLQSLSAL